MSLQPLFVQGVPEGDLFVDELATFEAGMVGQLQLSVDGVTPEVTVSDGSFPFGLFDDDKTNSFIVPHYQESISLHGTEISLLKFAPIVPNSVSIKDLLGNVLELSRFSIILMNGAISRLVNNVPPNNSTTGLNIVVNYQSYVQGLPDVDTTLGSSRVSIWTITGRYAIDVYDTTVSYFINDPLYAGDGIVAPKGVLTTKKPTRGPTVGCVVVPPTPNHATMQIFWKPPVWCTSPNV